VPEHLARVLEPYGACPEGVVALRREATPESLPYLDLLPSGDRDAVPDGVVESRGEPLAYVVDQESHSSEISLPLLKKTLTLRGDAPYLVVREPGRLTVYATSWQENPEPARLDTVQQSEDRAQTTFQRLSLALVREEGDRGYLHELLFRLLNDAIDGLIERGLGRDDAISLTGRALFLRFLLDRRVVQPEQLEEVCPSVQRPEQLFTGKKRVAASCAWLDATFNGDFLPLSFAGVPEAFRRIPEDAFSPLENVMHPSPGGQLLLDWGDLDFAHVPIGLLSQVYERQAAAWDPSGQRRESVYYTPFRIAELMVKEVFAGLRENGSVAPHQARVLDPASGGGIYLVSAFQEIVAAWWEHHGRRPDTREIRSILYEQLTGFEISEPALRLAALSLYLKAIELDLDPHPPEKLRFQPLRGQVLHGVRNESMAKIDAGSLGPGVPPSQQGAYDVVIGNPPWTTLGKASSKLHVQIVRRLRPLAAERLGKEQAGDFAIPDKLPDLPFVWRAMEWAKPGGSIAFALHGRLLFKSSEEGREAREALFQSLSVTGVLNGADLRETHVWPRIKAPFCLMFARNEIPGPDHAFYFTSPYREEGLNSQGRLRIDEQAAHPVALSRLREIPELLKVLYRGTAIDAAVLQKIRAHGWPTLLQFFGDDRAGVGYQVKGQTHDADFLKKLPEFTTKYRGAVKIDPETLPRFSRATVHRRRKKTIYEGPLVVARKSTPLDRTRGRAFCCLSDLAYSESFYGYSARGHREPEALARYLVLLFHSDLFLWHALLTSGQFGVERDALYKEDVDSFPLRPLEKLTDTTRSAIEPLSDALFSGEEPWREIDDWAMRVYGLSRWDAEAVRDTLATSLPYKRVRDESQRSPREAEMTEFVARLQRELEPFARTAGCRLGVHRLERPADSPWEILDIGLEGSSAHIPKTRILRDLLDRADQEGASQIVVVQPRQRRLLLAVLRQYRYWTPSRARLCALTIIQEHLQTLLGSQ
jgi:hypothetical protein